jgi:hypothetical protein
VPEKQQIELSIMANGYDNALEIDREIVQRFAVTRVVDGVMQLRISHTDRTWGADLEALLTGYLLQLRTRVSSAEQFANKRAGWIGFATGVGLFVIFMWGLIYTSAQVHAKYALSMIALSPDIRVLASRIDDLSSLIASGVGSQYTIIQVVFCIVSIIASIAAAIFVGSLASQTRPSALIITRKDAEMHAIAAARANRGFVHFVLSAPAALVLGVIGNYLFYLLSKFLAL